MLASFDFDQAEGLRRPLRLLPQGGSEGIEAVAAAPRHGDLALAQLQHQLVHLAHVLHHRDIQLDPAALQPLLGFRDNVFIRIANHHQLGVLDLAVGLHVILTASMNAAEGDPHPVVGPEYPFGGSNEADPGQRRG